MGGERTKPSSRERSLEVVNILKYLFVAGAVVEVALILRALYNLARDKARAAESPATAEE
jgi:hypothetical protein